MNLHDLLNALRRSLLLSIAIMLISVIAGLGILLTSRPQYQATAKVFVSVQQASSVQDLSQGATFTQQVVKSYADVATAPIVLEPVISRLNLRLSPAQLAEQIQATAPLNTVIIELSVTDSQPGRAARIANAVSDQLSRVVSVLTQTSNGSARPVQVTSIQAASVPASPISPNTALYIGLSIVAGVAIAIAVSLARQALSTKVRSEEDVLAVSDQPILAGFNFDSGAKNDPLIVATKPTSVRAEAFRGLRTNLQFLDLPAKGRSIVVTSSVASEGKTTTAANLALALAAAGERTIVVDADLRRPKIDSYFGIEGTIGLTDVLAHRTTLEEVLQLFGGAANLTILPAGSIPPNPGELVQSAGMGELLAKLSAEYDNVIIDAPPLLPVSDGAVLARRTHGAIVVAAARRVSRSQLRVAIANLEQIQARVLGLAVTMLPARGADASGRYGYGYGYGYGYSGHLQRESTDATVPTMHQIRDPKEAATSASGTLNIIDDVRKSR